MPKTMVQVCIDLPMETLTIVKGVKGHSGAGWLLGVGFSSNVQKDSCAQVPLGESLNCQRTNEMGAHSGWTSVVIIDKWRQLEAFRHCSQPSSTCLLVHL
jgi:hypothetical protein